jgi:hypothetical protein
MNAARQRIRALNDDLRIHHRGGRILITAGIQALPPDVILRIDTAVSRFDGFNDSNDPYGEHDCAIIQVAGRKIMFKIDYYDKDYAYQSADPADPEQTNRVMTIMLADEY